MKIKMFSVISVLLLLLFNNFILGQKYYKDITSPKLHDIEIPKVEQATLSNGIKVFILEDHELPLINLQALVHTGSVYEPADKVGLADITGTVMRTGGTANHSGDEIDEILEGIAAHVETWIDETSGGASMSVLKQDIDTGLNILADILMNPVFNEEKIELAKVTHRAIIARRNDQVANIAGREFTKLIYGPENVYARQTEYSTINSITRDDLIAFHKKYFHPNNMRIAIWGDFKKNEIINKLENVFRKWKKADLDIPPIPKVNYEFKPSVNLIVKEDVNQTNILMGHIGGRRDNPDYFAMILTNQILGIGSSSRLFKSVRSRQGLAYSVFGVYSAQYDHPGIFYVGCQTKSESTVKAIHAMLNEVKKMTESEVTDEELSLAKDAYLNSFVFNFDSRGEIVTRLMTYDYYNYPADFLQKTKESIENVTKADILRVSKKYLKYNEMQILAVGKPSDFDESLSTLGKVSEIDITIPVPKEEETPKATEVTLSKGRELMAKSIQVLGGTEAFKSIKTMKWDGNMTAVTPQGEMEMAVSTLIMMPDKIRANIQTPMGEMSQILNGDQAWIVSAQGKRPAPDQIKEQIQTNLWHNVSYLYANADQEGLMIQFLGLEDVDGTICEVLYITPKDIPGFKLFLDKETHMPVKMSFKGMTMMGAPAATEQIFSDFRELGNIKLPFKSVTNQDGNKAQEALASEILINVDVEESQFTVNE